MQNNEEQILLINFAYQTIIFLEFLDNSLKNYISVIEQYASLKLKDKKPNLQNDFRNKNNQTNHLYEKNKLSVYNENGSIKKKENIIKSFLTENKNINTSNSVFINSLINDKIFAKILEHIEKMLYGNNDFYRFISKETIEYFSISCSILINLNKVYETKITSINEDYHNYTKSLLELNEKDNQLKQLKNQLKKDKKELNSKHSNEIFLLNSEIINLKHKVKNSEINEINAKNKINKLKNKINDLEKENEIKDKEKDALKQKELEFKQKEEEMEINLKKYQFLKTAFEIHIKDLKKKLLICLCKIHVI